MGNPLTKAVGNVLTKLMGNVLTEILGKVLDIYIMASSFHLPMWAGFSILSSGIPLPDSVYSINPQQEKRGSR